MGKVQQSAAIPYRIDNHGLLEVLLVTSRSRRRWILPKGRVPRDMLPHISAMREALQEGGVVGIVSHEPVADYEQKKVGTDGSTATIQVRAYPLAVSSEVNVWREMDRRKRRWMSLNQAISEVADSRLQRVLKIFRKTRRCSAGCAA